MTVYDHRRRAVPKGLAKSRKRHDPYRVQRAMRRDRVLRWRKHVRRLAQIEAM
jgi:hypothetical protein